ncbi:MAG: hypothetical protein LBG97_03985 [Coriobacteriales bacterium]|jgi:hypothetical protein|nr:hypothetical protein [Coriobacteriales bacterium]
MMKQISHEPRRHQALLYIIKCFFLILLVVLQTTVIMAFFGCAPAGTIKDASPRYVAAQIAAAGDGSESGQKVELRLRFNAPVAINAADAALGDFKITLNNKELDKDAIRVELEVDSLDATTLLVTFMPAKGAGGPSSAHYFALYDGALSIAASNADGALPHVLLAGDSSACAILSNVVSLQVPSGLRILNQGEINGSEANNTLASCVFRVMAVPNVRVMAFIELSPGGERIKLHNHEFYNYTDTNRDEFASMLAEEIKTLLGDEYLVVPSADSVTIAHNKLVDEEVLLPRVIEGTTGD